MVTYLIMATNMVRSIFDEQNFFICKKCLIVMNIGDIFYMRMFVFVIVGRCLVWMMCFITFSKPINLD